MLCFPYPLVCFVLEVRASITPKWLFTASAHLIIHWITVPNPIVAKTLIKYSVIKKPTNTILSLVISIIAISSCFINLCLTCRLSLHASFATADRTPTFPIASQIHISSLINPLNSTCHKNANRWTLYCYAPLYDV